MEEDNGLCKVIKGPWKETPVKQLDEVKSELEMKKEFAENLTQELIVHMIQMCHNSEIRVDDERFIQDIGIIIEFTRGLVYRAVKMEYPTQDIVDTFVRVIHDDDGRKHTEVDMEQLRKTIESLHKDEE
ncbi:MAG: hypothetical protein HN962_05045 [Actinobacteria bacterium]|nr:hypothetical protein [Actinomycetota bacterium]MBT7014277.1 hypothetical protein [Actinomycetota bacterium]